MGLGAVGIAGAAIAAGIGIFGVMATKAASEFAAAMTLIHTQAGASEEEVRSMTAAVLALSPAVGFGPEALATALFHIESAGLRGGQALDILTLAAKGAKVGHADLESVTNGLIATVNSGISGVHNMTEGMGVLNAIVGAGNLRMGELTASFGSGILSVASTFGVSIQSVGAAIADMASQGIPAEVAATRLRMTISQLGAPTDKAASVLKDLGISSTQLASDMRSGGILQAVQDLKTHLDNSGLSAEEQAAALARAFGGGRSSAGIMTLLNSVEKLSTVQDQVNAGTGTFGEAWTATAAETETAGARFQATLESITTAIGTGFLPVVNQILAAVQPVITGIATWTANNPQLAATILAVVAGIGAFAAILAVIGGIIGALTGTIGLVVIAVAAIGVAFATNFGGIRDIVMTVAGVIGNVFGTAVSTVSGIINNVAGPAFGILKGIFDAIASVIRTVVGWFSTFIQHLTAGKDTAAAANTVFQAISTTFGIIHDVLSTVVNIIATVVTAVADVATKMGVLKIAGDLINTAFGLLGDLLHAVFINMVTVAGILGGALTIAFNAIKTVIGALSAVIRTVIDDLKSLIDFAGKAVNAVANVGATGPGGKGGLGDAISSGFNPIGTLSNIAKGLGIPGFATGGVVPGSGPRLAVVHGGETITPNGQSGPINVTIHSVIELEGDKVGEVLERRLFNSASVFSSGFVGSPQTT